MRKWIGVLLAISLIVWMYPGKAAADDNTFESVFKDGLYGGLAGGLVGGAVLVFAKHPEDHYIYIGYGAAIGVIVGTAFGVVSASRSMAEIDDHRVVFHLPIPEVSAIPVDRGHFDVVTSIGLVTVRF
jgi:hypothetical protein